MAVRAAALPADASCEDLEIDPALPFLDAHVASALANGAAPYITEEQRFAMGAVRPSHDEVRRRPSPSLQYVLLWCAALVGALQASQKGFALLGMSSLSMLACHSPALSLLCKCSK